MTPRLRLRPLMMKLSLLGRESVRRGRVRMFAALAVTVTLVGGTSVGFALNQESSEPVGLHGVWPDFPPPSLSGDAFSRLDGNWASWSEQAAIDVAEMYAVAEMNLDEQRQALEKVKSRVRVLERALRDPAYSMIRDELTSVLVPLRLRAQLFERSLELVTTEGPVDVGSATDQAANDVRAAITSLESDLRSIPNGTAWLPYLRVEEVRGSVGTPAGPDVLAGLPDRLDPNAERLSDEQKQFLSRKSIQRYADAIADYLAAHRIAKQGIDKERLREQLAALIRAIDAHEDSPTSATARDIRNARSELRRAAGPITASIDELIRRNYLNYNFRLVADAPVVAKMVSTQDINTGQVVDYFSGARIYGNQTTSTNVNIEFVPSNDMARFNLTLDGVSNSRTNAYTSQATISSVGQHQFHAVKPIAFDGDQFILGPADLSVNPNIRHIGAATKYDNILFGLFRGHIRRTALRRANERLPAGRAHAAQRLRENVLPEFNSEVDQSFGELNARLMDSESRLRRQGLAPQAERTRTTSDRFLFDAAIRGADEISGGPPNIGSTRGVGFTLQIHESLLNNAADRWGFGGRTMTDAQIESELERWFSDLLGRQVDLNKDGSNREPTTLVFTETDPIRFEVVNGAVVLILRAGIIQEDGEEIPPQIVEVPLNLSVQNGRIVIERGTIIVSPVDPPRNRALQITRAGVMRRKLEQAIEGGTRDGVITIERDGRSPTTIHIQRIEANAGWLTIYGV